MKVRISRVIFTVITLFLSAIIFLAPLYFMIVNSFKDETEAAEKNISWPSTLEVVSNYKNVLTDNDYLIVEAFINSTIITVFSTLILVVVASMTGFVLQRRASRTTNFIDLLILVGLMIPPAVVPTIWVLEGIGLFKTLTGMILVQVALHFPFATILYKAFMGTIPKEIDESAFIDGAGGLKLYTKLVFPLMKSVTSTVVIVTAVDVYNDFVHPLYFLPGKPTVQLTLYNFTGMFVSSWNYLFTAAVLISLPPLILFIFFNKRITEGMTAGSVKG